VAPLASALENLGFLGLSLLAVAGGAVVGALLTALAVWATCRYFAKKQPPPFVRKVLRWLGGIAGALAVAGYLHFGGGSGWLLESGPGLGGDQTGGHTTPRSNVPPAKAPDSAPKTVAEPLAPRADRVRVAVLGGELVRGRAFYRIEGEKQPTDLNGVREAVAKRRQSGPLAGVDILIYQNSLDYNTDGVKQLRAWVTESGLTPNLIELRGDIPP
jgi:hypothetical protein